MQQHPQGPITVAGACFPVVTPMHVTAMPLYRVQEDAMHDADCTFRERCWGYVPQRSNVFMACVLLLWYKPHFSFLPLPCDEW